MKKIKVISFCLTVISLALIFFFSSQTSTESNEVSEGFLAEVLDYMLNLLRLSGDNKKALIDTLHFLIRKCAHFTEFAVLGFSSVVMFRTWYRGSDYKIGICAAELSAAWAIGDEIHQLFVDGRTSRFFDVCIDTLGALTGIMIFLLIRKIYLKYSRKLRRSNVDY